MKQTPTTEGKRRRNFYLHDKLMAEVESVADQRHTTTTEIVRRALEAWLQAYRKQQEQKHG